MIAIGITVFISLVAGSIWAYSAASVEMDDIEREKERDEDEDNDRYPERI
ncbi:MAG: hypothetical protein J6M17_10265 [Ruminococcus sp.]|nr:hypothetical protein [Ruminococcus sp.]